MDLLCCIQGAAWCSMGRRLSPPEWKHALEQFAPALPPLVDPYYCSRESCGGLGLGQSKLPAGIWVNHSSAAISQPTPSIH